MTANFPIPIIDLFAGPGGLGEGFSSLKDEQTMKNIFKISLSIEMEHFAHQTLTLRSFFRQFDEVPSDYYEFIKGKISLEQLFQNHPEEAVRSKKEAWQARLGEKELSISNSIVDDRIKEALNGRKDFLLIGGPPCQAYSLVGRSRRKEIVLNEEKDEKVGLYKQYLRILAVHNPSLFVMENVKGILSAKTEENPVFEKILTDLADPVKAYHTLFETNGIDFQCPGYKIYSLVHEPREIINGIPQYKPTDFLIKSEEYGIPQARHRVILLGIRNDIKISPERLKPYGKYVSIKEVLSDLPKLRSGLSKLEDTSENWHTVIKTIESSSLLNGIDEKVIQEIKRQLEYASIIGYTRGSEFKSCTSLETTYQTKWFNDSRIIGVCNHQTRSHIESDLLRYFFAACYANVYEKSPNLENYPKALLPDHKNIMEGVNENKFGDRFRVQLWDSPSKTITSHISKDGHYYIHPDPTQCRSLTVREAARIQTFPDNYFFCGPRTAQFIQVGNAVPPYLASQIGKIVAKVYGTLNLLPKDS